MGNPDQNLLRQATSGDTQALVGLLEEHTPAVGQRLAGKIPQRWQPVLSVDDVMQQTCADAFLGIGRFVPQGERSFAAWLSTIAKRNLLNALEMLEAEKRGGGRQRMGPVGRDESLVELYELLSAGATTPSQHAARKDACGTLEHAIRQLPETYRRAVQMYDIEGRPVEEVARALQRTPGAVHMIRARAHSRLQVLMGSASKYFTTA